LGEYLRARRELVRPADVGLPDAGRRRVPGLRREELAGLAGISPDYYLRLEQGRDFHPSEQVVDALARALRLDEDETAHLHILAYPAIARSQERSEHVSSSIRRLIDSWPMSPAFVHGRRMDVLVANAISLAVFPFFRPGANAVKAVFLDPTARSLYRDWEDVAAAAVARLRVLVGPRVDDPGLDDIVEDLSARSAEFRRLWGRHDIRVSAPRLQTLNHPLVGTLELQPERLAVAAADGQMLVVCHAEAGSPSERALARLAESTATERA
jgi:transcriptional regulator with XRE-family HTH domain